MEERFGTRESKFSHCKFDKTMEKLHICIAFPKGESLFSTFVQKASLGGKSLRFTILNLYIMKVKETDLAKIQAEIDKYENEIESLEKVKQCSDIGPFAIKYIDKHVLELKKQIFDLHTKIDMLERD